MSDLSVMRGAALWCLTKNFGYPSLNQPEDAENDLRFCCKTKGGKSYRSQLLLYPDEQIARVLIHFDIEFTSERKPFFAEVAHRLNCEVAVLGFFLFDWDTGQTTFTFGAEIPKIEAAAFEKMVNRTAYAISVWEAAAGFFNGKLSPEGVVSVARMLSEV